jgi:deoxyribodipyrimidine photo-lyase
VSSRYAASAAICELLEANHVVSYLFKDQVIFEEKEITKSRWIAVHRVHSFKNKWLEKYKSMAPVQSTMPLHFTLIFIK